MGKYKHREDGSKMQALAWYVHLGSRLDRCLLRRDKGSAREMFGMLERMIHAADSRLIRACFPSMVEVPVPDITEPEDVVVKVTGTTICGSDLRLYHGEIVPLQSGDILGHEACPFMSLPPLVHLANNRPDSSLARLTASAPT
jgi:hypothetical protein